MRFRRNGSAPRLYFINVTAICKSTALAFIMYVKPARLSTGRKKFFPKSEIPTLRIARGLKI